MNSEQNISIDINTHKLLDWLISRHIVNANWQKNILPVREKINNAIQDMPQHPEIAQLLAGAYINYFHCLRIIEILKETEADTKNVFGRYGSQRMKDWLEIVKLYEKDNLYLAEAAHLLISNVKYEIPNMKKRIAKCFQNQKELEKRELEYSKNEHSARSELEALYRQLGIAGVKVKRELMDRVGQLPEIYNRIAEHMAIVKPAIKYYSAFTQHIYENDNPVPLLKYVSEHGNTTTFEWLFGERPTSIQPPPPVVTLDEEEDTKDETIDWGTDDNINYDISYEITLEESGIEVEPVETGENDSGIAKGNSALTVIDNPDTRQEFINQLLELESFLKVRLLDMQGDSDLLIMTHLAETTQSVTAMLDSVQVAKQLIMDSATQHLHNIKHSFKYVDHLITTVDHKKGLVEKLIASQKVVHEQAKEACEEGKSLQPKLQLIINKTKELQSQIENDISKKYKNRPVYLMGGVNTL